MADVFSKRKRSEVLSRICAALRQPLGRGSEIAPDESAQTGDVQPIPHAPLFGSAASKIKAKVSEAQPAAFESLNLQPSTLNRLNG